MEKFKVYMSNVQRQEQVICSCKKNIVLQRTMNLYKQNIKIVIKWTLNRILLVCCGGVVCCDVQQF